jgi:hypothetical protein
VPTMDMKVHPRDGDLVLGTFGRSFWILDDINFLREIAKSKGDVLNKNLKLFQPSSDAYLAYYRSYDGERFAADAVFEGKNKSPLATLTVWNKAKKPEAKKEDVKTDAKKADDKTDKAAKPMAKTDDKKDEKKADKAKIVIFNEQGDTVRNYSVTHESFDLGVESQRRSFPKLGR